MLVSPSNESSFLINFIGWFVRRSVDWFVCRLLDERKGKGKSHPRTGHEDPEGD